MADAIYSQTDTITLANVTFTGDGEGQPGSSLQWDGFIGGVSSADNDLVDVGADGVLVDGIDTWFHGFYTFTGYTVTIGGTEYPIFEGFGNYTLIIPDGSANDFVPETGPSNSYQSPEGNAFLCFAAGTFIATPDGETEVQRLQIGDLVTTNGDMPVRVKWIGRQTVSSRFRPAERLMPVRFAAGSLGDGLPHSDLTVTADHAMLVDGVLCNAGALVNGTTITRVPLAEMGERYTVYHIETDAHEIILANGAPAETFIDNVSRRVFDNYAEFEALYGDVPEMEELPLPRAMSARQVPETIRKRLLSGGLETASASSTPQSGKLVASS